MDTLTLIDTNRNRALAGLHCTVSQPSDKGIGWLRALGGRTHTFVVLNDTLVIGTVNDDSHLYAIYMTRELPIEEATAQVEALSTAAYSTKGVVTAAGKIDAYGNVEWGSECFKVGRPESMDDAAKIMGMFHQLSYAGALSPDNVFFDDLSPTNAGEARQRLKQLDARGAAFLKDFLQQYNAVAKVAKWVQLRNFLKDMIEHPYCPQRIHHGEAATWSDVWAVTRLVFDRHGAKLRPMRDYVCWSVDGILEAIEFTQ